MMRNYEILREHRQFMEKVRDERREEEERRKERQVEEAAALRQIGLQPFSLSAPSATADGTPDQAPATGSGKGTMYQRCAALEEHSAVNEGAMQRNRTLLDDVHAVRRAQAHALGFEYHPRGGPDLAMRVRAQHENSRWMGPALQGAAYVKAMATEKAAEKARAEIEACAETGSQAEPDLLEGTMPEEQRRSRPTSAASRTSEVPPFPSRPGNRPQSAKVDALQCWAGQAGSRCSSATRLGAARPSSAARRPASRPGSAGSMKARCLALQDNMKRTQQILEAHRVEIDEVHDFRRNAAQRMMNALHREFVSAAAARG